MRYCSNCNTEIAGRFCTACGADSAAPQGVTIDVPVRAATAIARPAAARPPGYVTPATGVPVQSMGTTADNRFTHDAEFLLRSTGERIAWQGKPSIVSILPRAFVWTLVLLFALGLFGIHYAGFLMLLAFVAVLHVGAAYLNWRHTTYRITSQRIEYSSGVISCTTAASPLAEIGNVTIRRPFPWNLLSLGHLELDIPDQAAGARNGVRPKVLLRCVQHLETVRDLIHSSSGILNQAWDQSRYGR